MMPTIRIEDDVFQGLQRLAQPFTDTPNTVIRRLLEGAGILTVPNKEPPPPSPAPASSAKAAPLTPQPVYETFLLHVLAHKFKGKAHKHEASAATIQLMKERGHLNPADHHVVSTGETRAENTIAWGRNALKDRGLISHLSPRGMWELTDDGLKEGLKVFLPPA